MYVQVILRHGAGAPQVQTDKPRGELALEQSATLYVLLSNSGNEISSAIEVHGRSFVNKAA